MQPFLSFTETRSCLFTVLWPTVYLGVGSRPANCWCNSRRATMRTAHGFQKSSYLNSTWKNSGNDWSRMVRRLPITTSRHENVAGQTQ